MPGYRILFEKGEYQELHDLTVQDTEHRLVTMASKANPEFQAIWNDQESMASKIFRKAKQDHMNTALMRLYPGNVFLLASLKYKDALDVITTKKPGRQWLIQPDHAPFAMEVMHRYCKGHLKEQIGSIAEYTLANFAVELGLKDSQKDHKDPWAQLAIGPIITRLESERRAAEKVLNCYSTISGNRIDSFYSRDLAVKNKPEVHFTTGGVPEFMLQRDGRKPS